MLTAAQYLNIIQKYKTNRLCEGKFDRKDRLTVEFDAFQQRILRLFAFYFIRKHLNGCGNVSFLINCPEMRPKSQVSTILSKNLCLCIIG